MVSVVMMVVPDPNHQFGMRVIYHWLWSLSAMNKVRFYYQTDWVLGFFVIEITAKCHDRYTVLCGTP